MSSRVESRNPGGIGRLGARIVGALLNAFLWSMVVALAFNRWTWLEMRFNIGWIFLAVWIIVFVLLLWRTRKPLGFVFSIVNTAVCVVIGAFLCGGVAQMLVIPACLIREGLMHATWNIALTNIVVVAFVIVCLLAKKALNSSRRSQTVDRSEEGDNRA